MWQKTEHLPTDLMNLEQSAAKHKVLQHHPEIDTKGVTLLKP